MSLDDKNLANNFFCSEGITLKEEDYVITELITLAISIVGFYEPSFFSNLIAYKSVDFFRSFNEELEIA